MRFEQRLSGIPQFRRGLLCDAVEALLSGELEMAKSILRDYIHWTTSFPKLAERTGFHAKSLRRMLGPKGNPSMRNFARILTVMQQHEHMSFIRIRNRPRT